MFFAIIYIGELIISNLSDILQLDKNAVREGNIY